MPALHLTAFPAERPTKSFSLPAALLCRRCMQRFYRWSTGANFPSDYANSILLAQVGTQNRHGVATAGRPIILVGGRQAGTCRGWLIIGSSGEFIPCIWLPYHCTGLWKKACSFQCPLLLCSTAAGTVSAPLVLGTSTDSRPCLALACRAGYSDYCPPLACTFYFPALPPN